MCASFLGIEDCHVLVIDASGGVGSAAAKEFLGNGCRVTALDKRPVDASTLSIPESQTARLFSVLGDLRDDDSVARAFRAAADRFGPPQILIANGGVTDESSRPAIWELDTKRWDEINAVNVRGEFLTIKHFLLAVKAAQDLSGRELPNVAIVVTGSETGVFGQEGHAEYASGKAVLQYGLVKMVKSEMVRLNSKARINAVAIQNIAAPSDVARCMAFLASHRAAGHITGQCISVDGDQEGCHRRKGAAPENQSPSIAPAIGLLATSETKPQRKRRMRISITVDFDAISGYIGTGYTPQNTLSDYSAGAFSGNVGVGRLLRLFQKYGISKEVTWFIPGHSIESFPKQTKAIVQSGAEIGLHGYSHEGAHAMTVEQEREVLEKCIKLGTSLLSGKRPVGYRAPLYQIRGSTINLLQEHGFLYDSSLNAHDSLPYLLQKPFPERSPHIPDYKKPASTWMVPFVIPESPVPGSPEADKALVEIPSSWYTEDITPLGYYPYSPSTQGYVSVEVVEMMWWNRFEWLWENECWLDEGDGVDYGSVFPLIWHPQCAGRSHVIGMLDRFIGKLVAKKNKACEGEISFDTMESVAKSYKHRTK